MFHCRSIGSSSNHRCSPLAVLLPTCLVEHSKLRSMTLVDSMNLARFDPDSTLHDLFPFCETLPVHSFPSDQNVATTKAVVKASLQGLRIVLDSGFRPRPSWKPADPALFTSFSHQSDRALCAAARTLSPNHVVTVDISRPQANLGVVSCRGERHTGYEYYVRSSQHPTIHLLLWLAYRSARSQQHGLIVMTPVHDLW